MVRAVSLKVEKSNSHDIGQNIVRIDGRKRKELGVEVNDAVIVRSDIAVITAIVKTTLKHDVGKNILKLDEKQRQMLGVDNGSTVDTINYLDYKLEEEKLKPQPLLLKDNVPHQVVYTQEYTQTVADNVVAGDYVGGSQVHDSLVQRSSLGEAGVEESAPQGEGRTANLNRKVFCPNCGAENESQYKFCVACGGEVKICRQVLM